MQYTGVIKMIMRLGEVFLRALGKPLVKFLSSLGDLTSFILKAIYHCFVPPFYFKLFFKQVLDIGFYSLPVVGLSTLFAGMVIALQTYSGFSGFKAENVIASVVLISVTRELAPVLSALMVAGRIGAAMAAEIGTMRVTEQIDALVTLSTNPFKYLVAPRLWAGLLVLPLLVLIGDIIGIFGGYVVGVYKLGFNPANYISATFQDLQIIGIVSGLVKAAVFGFIISMMGCYHGYKSKGGAQGVGNATTNAVVSSSILILIFNYLITEMFFSRLTEADMAKEIKIKIRDLHKSFRKKHVLNGVDLDLYKGESLVVIGGSGTGKSVLIKCIQGLLIPDSGSIEIDDIEIANENPDVIDSMHSKM